MPNPFLDLTFLILALTLMPNPFFELELFNYFCGRGKHFVFSFKILRILILFIAQSYPNQSLDLGFLTRFGA